MTMRARQEILTTDPAERARSLALAILDRAPRSAADLRARLIAKDVPDHVADALIARYQEVGLLDDAAYAAAIARTRHAERGQAPMAIAHELRRKGFRDEDIAAALEPIDASSQREAALRIARKRWDALSAHPMETRTRRVAAFLGRKGYAPSLAFGIVTDLGRAERSSAAEREELSWSTPPP